MSRSLAELDSLLLVRPASPRAQGRVAQLCLRRDVDQRDFPDEIELCPMRGAIGDRWERRTWMHLPDGRSDPRVQVAVAERRTIQFLQEITGCSHHPGDTLIVDLDLSGANLPIGSRLRAGTAMIEVSDVENDACAKFAKHYGDDVLAWIRAPENRERRLRGLFARVVAGGFVQVGDGFAKA